MMTQIPFVSCQDTHGRTVGCPPITCQTPTGQLLAIRLGFKLNWDVSFSEGEGKVSFGRGMRVQIQLDCLEMPI